MTNDKNNTHNIKSKFYGIKQVTPWDEIKENTVYHIPPIKQLNRREIFIVKKDDNEAVYYKTDDKNKSKRTLAKTSIFAKFIVKRKKF